MTPNRTPVWPVITVVLTGIALFVACGMKGPPRAPLIIVPNAVGDLEVRRLEGNVFLRFAVPDANTNGSRPPDLERVEVYGLTTNPDQDPARQPPLEDWLEAATLVATFSVRLPDDEAADLPEEEAGVAPGEQVVLVESLGPELLVPHVFDDESDDDDESSEEDETAALERPIPMPLVSPPLPGQTRRTYLVRAVSTRGRESAPSARVAVPLAELPTPPPPPIVTYTEGELLVEWTPAVGARRPVQEGVEPEPEPGSVEPDGSESEGDGEPQADLEGRLESRPIVPMSPPSTYLVYAVGSERAAATDTLPTPLNMPAVGVLSYREDGVRFGAESCYAVRVRNIFDELPIEGPASPPTCVVPDDTFPPGPPTGVVAVASEGAISLVWDPSPELDIAGYLVLRRAAAGATLQPLTLESIEGTSFRDDTVTADEDYVYAVQAVDSAVPPNVSPPSVEVTEQAR